MGQAARTGLIILCGKVAADIWPSRQDNVDHSKRQDFCFEASILVPWPSVSENRIQFIKLRIQFINLLNIYWLS
jgi:hypothetical protein